MKPQIETIIPFRDDCRLGQAIFEQIQNCNDWILILDHDVLIVTPVWYDICQSAIERLGKQAGWITCLTNKIGCPVQKAGLLRPDNENMNDHFDYAKVLFECNKGKIVENTNSRWKFSGFFVLTNKQAFMKVYRKFGCMGSKFIGWDNWYYDRLIELGYTTHVMQDLYCYHSYRRLWNDKFWKSSKELICNSLL